MAEIGQEARQALNMDDLITGYIPRQADAEAYIRTLPKTTPFKIESGADSTGTIQGSPMPQQLGDIRADILKRFDTDTAKTQESRQAINDKFDARLKTANQGLSDTIGKAQATAEKGVQSISPPTLPKFEPTEIQNTMGMLVALAAFSGAMSRQPFTASINALAGLVEGVKSGDQIRFDRSYKEWEAASKAVTAQNKAYLDKYNSIMDSSKLSITEKTRQLRELDVQEKREFQLAADDASDITNRAKIGASMIKQQEDFEKTVTGWEFRKAIADDANKVKREAISGATERARLMREARGSSVAPAVGGVTDTADTAAAWSLLLNGKVPTGMYSYDKVAREKLRVAYGKLLSDNGITPEQAALIPIANASVKTALSQQVQREAATAVAQEKLINHGRFLIQLVEKMGNEAKLMKWNQLQVWADKQLNDPIAVELGVQLALFGNEFGRLSSPTSNAMLPEGARTESRELLSTGFTTATMEGVVGILERDAEISHAAFANERKKLMGMISGSGHPAASASPGWSDEKEKRYQELRAKHGAQ